MPAILLPRLVGIRTFNQQPVNVAPNPDEAAEKSKEYMARKMLLRDEKIPYKHIMVIGNAKSRCCTITAGGKTGTAASRRCL